MWVGFMEGGGGKVENKLNIYCNLNKIKTNDKQNNFFNMALWKEGGSSYKLFYNKINR